MPYRIAAAPEPDPPPDVEEPYVAVLRAQQRRTKLGAAVITTLGIGAAVAVTTGSMPGRPAPDGATSLAARHVRARAAVTTARANVSAEQARFESGMRAAIGDGVVPRPHLGACPIVLPRPSGALHRHPFPLLVVDRVDLAGTLPSQAIAELLVDLGRAESHLAAGRSEEAQLYANALDAPGRLRFDVVMVASERQRPRATGPGTYEPGRVAGRAYLYDFASKRVVCAADVETGSSEAISYSYLAASDAPASRSADASLAASLESDLDRRLETAIADAMRYRSGAPSQNVSKQSGL